MIRLSHIFQNPPMQDWVHLGIFFGGIFLFIAIAEVVRKALHWSQEASRKVVHVAVGLLMLFTPLYLSTSLPLLLMAAFFVLFNWAVLKLKLLPGMNLETDNLGTVYYPFSFLILVLLFWDGYKVVIMAAVTVMAFGDAAAAMVGGWVKRPHRYVLIRDPKSLEGSAAMFVTSVITLVFTFLYYRNSLPVEAQSIPVILLFAVLIALPSTAAEALGHKGNDNLLVPLMSGAITFFLVTGNQTLWWQFVLGMVLGAVIAILSYRAGFLSASGAVATFLLAVVIFGFGGVQWTVPILTFFILSSLLSRFGKQAKARFELIFEKGSQRDYAQVFANGGVAGLLMIIHVLFRPEHDFVMYLGALAAATADTWATELGVLWGRRPHLIHTWQPVPVGTSGGVTLGGSFGAFLGAVILGMSGMVKPSFFVQNTPLQIVIVVALAGFLASVVDSFIGATLQAQYRCPVCGKITEKTVHCQGKPTALVRGIPRMNNDMVNFIATISGAFFAYLGMVIL